MQPSAPGHPSSPAQPPGWDGCPVPRDPSLLPSCNSQQEANDKSHAAAHSPALGP